MQRNHSSATIEEERNKILFVFISSVQ